LCIEVKAGTDVSKLLPYLMARHNSATGLPLPLDMIDQNVGLPRGFTREFVDEIEANLVRDSELDKFDLQNHFAHLNPQKAE
jgi:poly(3-hydroxyalkanoate) synthetase